MTRDTDASNPFKRAPHRLTTLKYQALQIGREIGQAKEPRAIAWRDLLGPGEVGNAQVCQMDLSGSLRATLGRYDRAIDMVVWLPLN